MIVDVANWSISRRLLGSFALVGAIFAGSVAYTIHVTRGEATVVSDVLEHHVPLAISASRLVADIRGVGSDARGLLLTGDETTRSHWERSWTIAMQRIAQMKEVAQHEKDAALITEIDAIAKMANELRQTQTDIIAIAFKPESNRALHALETTIAPRIDVVLGEAQRAVDVEFLLEANNERKHLLKGFADVQSHLSTAASHLRLFLDHGKSHSKDAFWLSMIEFRTGLELVQGRRHLLNAAQKDALETIEVSLAGIDDDLAKVVSIRESNSWNTSLHMLRTLCMPQTEMLLSALDGTFTANGPRKGGFDDRQLDQVEKMSKDVQGDLTALQTVQIGFLAFSLLVGALVALLASRSICRPVDALTAAMGRLKDGDTASPIPGIARGDEVGLMARAVAVFRDAAIDKARIEREAEAARIEAEENRRKAAEEQARMERAAAEQRAIAEKARLEAAEAEAAAGRERQKAIDMVSAGLARLAEQDLTVRLREDVPAAYAKLKTDFNLAVQRLESVIQSVKTGTGSIMSGTREIATGADDLSRRTEQQAASLEQTSAALTEITSTVRKAAESAAEARQVVNAASADAAKSGEVVRRTVSSITSIQKSSQEISQIIGVIDEIAFQTNLLALNAGVEAARAGEAGRGFAVVATEVRALAQRSADAARQIKTLISSSGQQVSEGVVLVGETGAALERIIATIANIDKLMSSIADSAGEQAQGLQQVSTAVGHMDQNTQQTAAMVEESTAASRTMAEEAAKLDALSASFRVGSAPNLRNELKAVAPHVFREPAKVAPSARQAGSAATRRAAATAPAPRARVAAASASDGWEEF